MVFIPLEFLIFYMAEEQKAIEADGINPPHIFTIA
jgi:hypothetical protein